MIGGLGRGNVMFTVVDHGWPSPRCRLASDGRRRGLLLERMPLRVTTLADHDLRYMIGGLGRGNIMIN
jgi:hypothetical protein